MLSCRCPETQREDTKADDSQFDESLHSEVCQNTIHNRGDVIQKPVSISIHSTGDSVQMMSSILPLCFCSQSAEL